VPESHCRRHRLTTSYGTLNKGSKGESRSDQPWLFFNAGNQNLLKHRRKFMAFFQSAVGVLQTLVIALGAGLGIWGVVNLMEGYGNDNPGANAHVP
jgi:hypothetical protein